MGHGWSTVLRTMCPSAHYRWTLEELFHGLKSCLRQSVLLLSYRLAKRGHLGGEGLRSEEAEVVRKSSECRRPIRRCSCWALARLCGSLQCVRIRRYGTSHGKQIGEEVEATEEGFGERRQTASIWRAGGFVSQQASLRHCTKKSPLKTINKSTYEVHEVALKHFPRIEA